MSYVFVDNKKLGAKSSKFLVVGANFSILQHFFRFFFFGHLKCTFPELPLTAYR